MYTDTFIICNHVLKVYYCMEQNFNSEKFDESGLGKF